MANKSTNRRVIARQAAATRWLYRVENELLKYNAYANADMSMKDLRAIAKTIWRAEGPHGRKLPNIVAGRGIKDRKKDTLQSFCEGYSEIVLARHQRTILVLLHELTHAIGPRLHKAKFIRTYFPLLQRYAGYSRWFLQTLADSRGILI